MAYALHVSVITRRKAAFVGVPPLRTRSTMQEADPSAIDMKRLLATVSDVLDRQTADTEIGRILMPGPTYLGIWARDTAISTLGLNRLGKTELAGELLGRFWEYQITAQSDPNTFVFRNKTHAGWTDADSFRPSKEQLEGEIGAFPTCVYIQTPDFPAGTQEIYTTRADLDGVAWLVIALHDHLMCSGDDTLVQRFAAGVASAISYLGSRDEDGDHLLEQGPNQDWADILLRQGKVAYSQAVWLGCLAGAAEIFEATGDQERAAFCRREWDQVRAAANRILMTRYGYYANFVAPDRVSYRRSLDTALLVAFGACDGDRACQVLEMLGTLGGPFGHAVIEPGFSQEAIGPSKYPPGHYQNEGIWPWITSFLAVAWARIGDSTRAREVIASVFRNQPATIHEWVDNLTGEAHHPDFATAAGALAWAIAEADATSSVDHPSGPRAGRDSPS